MPTIRRTEVARNAAITTIAVIAAGAAAFAASAGEKAFTRTAKSDSLEWGPCPAFMPAGCAIAVLNGNPAEPHADIFFRLPAGQNVPSHWHESPERMVLVSGEMQVDYEGQEPVLLTRSSYAYGPSRLPHDATCVSDEDCVLFIAFVDPIDAFEAE